MSSQAKRPLGRVAVLTALLLVGGPGVSCKRSAKTEGSKASKLKADKPAPRPRPKPKPQGLALDGNHLVGGAIAVSNLAVFPIYAKKQQDLGKFVTLPEALAAKQATVRESKGGATVGRLEIENKGDAAIFVLAGTVVKGGNQDRQISQDFIVGPGKTVPVDAFCVEQGRWSGSRSGKSTGGFFMAVDTLAHQSVRVAGQHVRNQGKVWSKVAQVNAANQAASSSGSLFATLDSAVFRKKRASLVAQLLARLAKVAKHQRVVGIAVAVDGKIKSVRWFVAHDLFQRFRKTLLNTAAFAALTAQGRRKGAADSPAGAGDKQPLEAARPADVKTFIVEMKKAAEKRRDLTKGNNENIYYEGKKGYKSKTVYIHRGKRAPAATEFTKK